MADELFQSHGGAMLGYSQVEGIGELLAEIARRGEISGFARSPDELLITSGASVVIETHSG